MISAIVYSSETGSCERYAKMLAEELKVPAKPLKYCESDRFDQVVYVGWLMAGKITGLDKAREKMHVCAVVQVGMGPAGPEKADEGRNKNKLPAEVAFFCKQGAFHMDKLPLPLRLAMTMMNKKLKAELEQKSGLDAQEQALYKMVTTGDGEPAEWNVDDVVAWCRQH